MIDSNYIKIKSFRNHRIDRVVSSMTTNEIHVKILNGSFDVKLIKQRATDLWTPEKKSRLFTRCIEQLFEGYFHLGDKEGWDSKDYKDRDDPKLIEKQKCKHHKHEVWDGIQKIGIIKQIMNNEIKCFSGTAWVYDEYLEQRKPVRFKEMFYKDLSPELKELFLNHRWNFSVYHKDTNLSEKGEIMRTNDTGMKMSDAELLNTEDAIGIAIISQTLFSNDEENLVSSKIKLFHNMQKNEMFTEDYLRRYKLNYFVKFLVSNSINRHLNKDHFSKVTNKQSIFDMVQNSYYFKDEISMNKIMNKIIFELNLVHDIFETNNFYDKDYLKKIIGTSSVTETMALCKNIIDLIQQIKDIYGEYNKGWKFSKPIFSTWLLKRIQFLLNDKEDEMLKSAYEQLTGKHMTWQIKKRNKLFLDEMIKDKQSGFIILSEQRTASKIILKKAWLSQGKKCPVTNKPVRLEDCVAAHRDTAYSQGGEPTLENTLAISKQWNFLQGTQSWDDFMKSLKKSFPSIVKKTENKKIKDKAA